MGKEREIFLSNIKFLYNVECFCLYCGVWNKWCSDITLTYSRGEREGPI